MGYCELCFAYVVPRQQKMSRVSWTLPWLAICLTAERVKRLAGVLWAAVCLCGGYLEFSV